MTTTLHLFEGLGIELEYMIVNRDTMKVVAVADKLFTDVSGQGESSFDAGSIGWSNELALHVVEVKNIVPCRTLEGLSTLFHEQITAINSKLQKYGCCLMPSGMHPFMDPVHESFLWPTDEENIYQTYNRIFNCSGHGWTNLQSIHCNISFADDTEFSRLHTAIRLVLPLLPALCASTPYVEGRATGILDNRLEFYRNNQKNIPMVTGRVIPELVFSRDEYENTILQPMYQQIAPFDPDAVVQYEWLNSRGAIARFDRMAIEIRLMDIQECPAADIAVCELVIATIKALSDEAWSSFGSQCTFTEATLESLLLGTIRGAGSSTIVNADYLSVIGVNRQGPVTALEVWKLLAEKLLPQEHPAHQALSTIFKNGTLAQRLQNSSGKTPTREQLVFLSRELCSCLSNNRMYV